MIKNVIFDYGRVLVDWSMHYLFDDYFHDDAKCRFFMDNICNAEWRSRSDGGEPMELCVRELQQEWPEWKEPIALFQEQWMRMVNGEMPGMSALVDRLEASGYGIYGLSNWPGEFYEQSRRKVPLMGRMEKSVISYKEHMVKPDVRIYRLLTDRYGLVPSECLFVDDVPANVEGARRAGLQGLVFEGDPESVVSALGI